MPPTDHASTPTPSSPRVGTRIQELADAGYIAEVPRSYAHAFDARQWEAVRSCFTADGVIEGSLGSLPATESLARSRALAEQCTATFHIITNQNVSVAGDSGHAASTVIGYDWRAEPPGSPHPANSIVGAQYLDTLERVGSGWLIAHRRIAVHWRATPTASV